ncbi:MAG TPA: RNA polymerase sigma factor region1.1 domain-containing protein, partial [Paraburkholderia sp.]|nr:RNA polymerase sigma factor region1.1 domain-containing protein [Paraburkholderia sp.]
MASGEQRATAETAATTVSKKQASKNPMPAAPADSALEADERRQHLRELIQLGRERGYLTHADISDHLQGNFADTAAMESIVRTFAEMGVTIYETTPDAEALLLQDNAAGTTDDQADEEAEVALSTVDSEFGRTTDPVRMYMREMSSATLLTRKEEVEIAMRIEDGLASMVHAICACPSTIATILDLSERVARDEMRIDELVDGVIEDGIAANFDAAAQDDTTADESEADDDADEGSGSAASEANLAQLKEECLTRFARVADQFALMEAAYTASGAESKGFIAAQEAVREELRTIRFTAKMIERLCADVHTMVEEVRAVERQILTLMVDRCGMSREEFIASFPGNETDLSWGRGIAAKSRPYSDAVGRSLPDLEAHQQKLIDI